ncbi:MAG: DUF3352 domain-containing protein, partial [Solirubrobacterales bacterium]
MKLRVTFSLIAALGALLLGVAGCGGGSSSAGPASFAPAKSPVFIEGVIRPSGELKANVDRVVEKIAGIENLGDFLIEKAEASFKEQGESFDYATEVEPWLGEEAGVFLGGFDGNNFSEVGVGVQVTDAGAAQHFIDERAKSNSGQPLETRSYQGVEYKVDPSDDTSLGVVGDFVVFGQNEQAFKDAVNASSGESLADEERFSNAIAGATDGSLANVYVDIGRLIDESGGKIEPEARKIL